MKCFSLIYQGNVHLSSTEKIIPADQFSVLLSAHEILQKAQEDVARYKKQVEEECEQLKEQAQKEGFQEGLEQFNAHVIHFDALGKALKMEMQKQVLPLALRSAKKIVAKELELHPDTIVEIVLQAIAPVVQNYRFTIYVNKEDKDILESQKLRIKEILEHLQVLKIQERADIERGGCVIETESGIINATVENQWRALEAAFEKYLSKNP